MHAGSELLFPPYAIAPLMGLRGKEWEELVARVAGLPETHRDSLAFSLMMIRLDGCLTCETDSYKAMRGCVQCAIQTIRRFKEGDDQLLKRLRSAKWTGISVITQIEFLAFSGLSEEDKRLFSQFLQRIDVIELTPKQKELIDLIVELRQQYRIKLPDAIIAATAIRYGVSLITADKQFQRIQELQIVSFV